MRFEKVEYEYFEKDSMANGFRPSREIYDAIKLPVRKTAGSAAYDFSTPYDVWLTGGGRRTVPTGIKAIMEQGEVLLLTVRSSVGIKDKVQFSNSLAVIDGDFANNKTNDGDIHLALWNTGELMVKYKAGDRLAQGLFVKFDTTEDDAATGERTGGIGSSGR